MIQILKPYSVTKNLGQAYFDDMVFKLMTEVGTQVKAYEKAEEIHYQVFGCNRYSSYESYYYAKR